MGMPVATTGGGICFAFPDVVNTVAGPATVPIPYPNIGQLSSAVSTSTTVKVEGSMVILKGSEIPTSSGDEAGTAPTMGKVTFSVASTTVKMCGDFVVRMGDTTLQNGGNAVGTVLGGAATVMCG